ncbi:unnamed protein product [Acanthoscelides obtectus]|uniref:Uncharacterized protein n=1 Tax=Acanthoscelides obtectus TaxID=200917 RepID=A0A9P0PIQ9_ACAOB|nr:unnamed protein product [Acanthoscelides obtectus]CAK1638256.1 hypothetical protein AOBTE_LOCUS10490 [Acanthoscelides obtectus]
MKSLGLRSGLYGGWTNNSTFSSVKYCLVFWAVCELALSCWRMILLPGLIFRSSAMTFGKQMVVHQSAVTRPRLDSPYQREIVD